MVRINVSQQLKESMGSVRSYKVSDYVEIDGVEMPLEGDLKLTRTDKGLLAEAKLRAELELTCSRCLGSFTTPLLVDIEEEYFPRINIVTGANLPLPDEPGCFTIDEHNMLDLTEAIRQYALISLPVKPLCREDCAGLCPTCGCNLNEVTCACPPPLDPAGQC